MNGVQLTDVRKTYGDMLAVDDFNLSIGDGEFVTIVGPSGSGKSTLLRMIAGLEDITSGEIQLDGTVINDVRPRDRDVAMVFQNYALYPHMTVRDNISYGLRLTSDLSEEAIRERVQEAAEMMGIEDQLEKKPGELSGGQQQRVATGRAIVREPKVFLMDEPLSNLDAKLRTHMRTELQRIQNDLGTTTVYVTHDQEEALTMSDRVVILDDGELQQVGTPNDVYYEPRNLFVAEFIGSPSMNTFEAELDGTTVLMEDLSFELDEGLAERVATNSSSDRLVVGVRPEHMSFVEAGDRNVIEAVLDVREPVGEDNYFYLRRGETEFTMRVLGAHDEEPGEHISVTFDEENLHVFDTETGENVLVDASSTEEDTLSAS